MWFSFGNKFKVFEDVHVSSIIMKSTHEHHTCRAVVRVSLVVRNRKTICADGAELERVRAKRRVGAASVHVGAGGQELR